MSSSREPSSPQPGPVLGALPEAWTVLIHTSWKDGVCVWVLVWGSVMAALCLDLSLHAEACGVSESGTSYVSLGVLLS